ncbi:MAG TPA: type II toxin-antitoxin system VapC family toxin [Thermoanaerobaculia bacterium]|nr:type II toxin-antitoxin system VapC family toxin [Thermoanaerobaculia bacterium]
MNLYAESSAVLGWLLSEDSAGRVMEALDGAQMVVASELTLIECDRTLLRARAAGELSDFETARRRNLLEAASAHWNLLLLGPAIVERARRPFPGEPLRTLDALHIASALAARSAVPGLALLTLDNRVRGSAAELGFKVVPATIQPARSPCV